MITNRIQEKEIPQVPSGDVKSVCLQWFYPHHLLCLSSSWTTLLKPCFLQVAARVLTLDQIKSLQ